MIDDSERDLYSIEDINGYCRKARLMVASVFADNVTVKEIDQYISLGQVEKFVEEFCDGHNSNGCPIVCDQIHTAICEAILVRIKNVGMAKLAADDILQVAFDEEINDFVFWEKRNSEKS
jgi:hypothetical protein